MKKTLFCDNCGKILEIKNIEEEKIIGICSCGFIKEFDFHITSIQKQQEKPVFGKGIISDANIGQGFPHKCQKCGYNESEVYDLGASYGDEASIYLFKCKKCGFVERQADGSGNK